MVGARNKVSACQDQNRIQLQNKLASVRWAQRRKVAGSGKRLGSFVCGADFSQLPPLLQLDRQACWRQRKL
jgi:hypothetical protein